MKRTSNIPAEIYKDAIEFNKPFCCGRTVECQGNCNNGLTLSQALEAARRVTHWLIKNSNIA